MQDEPCHKNCATLQDLSEVIGFDSGFVHSLKGRQSPLSQISPGNKQLSLFDMVALVFGKLAELHPQPLFEVATHRVNFNIDYYTT